MTDDRIPTLQSLLISGHRLIQLAARASGSTVPSATWRALGNLESRGPLRIGELATLDRVTQPGMSRLVGTMVDEGLVTREHDPEDSRASVIAITESGSRALADWRRRLADEVAPLFDDLAAAEWECLERATAILAERTTPVTASASSIPASAAAEVTA